MRETFPDATPVDHEKRIVDPNRLQVLERLKLMEASAEDALDRATRLAANMTGAPTSFFSVVDGAGQHFASHVGMPSCLATPDTPLSHSFCQYVVSMDRTLSVSDSLAHPMLGINGAAQELGVRSYMGVPVHAPEGHVLGSLCVISPEVRDWTDEEEAVLTDLARGLETEIALREEATARKLLVSELNHRVKNIFAMVAGMVRMSSRDAKDLDTFAKAIEMRVSALANAHALIIPDEIEEAGATETSLQALVATLVEPHLSGDEERFTIDGPPVMLAPKAATNAALVLHELATNAAKYGALQDSDGTLSVTWEVTDETLNLRWSERAGTQADAEAVGPTGFGSRLVTMVVTNGLGGQMDLDTDGGYSYRLSVPMASLSGVAAD